MTSSPFVWVFICWGNKGKILFNSQYQVDNRFLSFSLFEGDFFLRKAFVTLLKFQMVFRDEDEKRIVPTALKGFSPRVSQRQETKYSN